MRLIHKTSPLLCGLVWLFDCWSAQCYALANGKIYMRSIWLRQTRPCWTEMTTWSICFVLREAWIFFTYSAFTEFLEVLFFINIVYFGRVNLWLQSTSRMNLLPYFGRVNLWLESTSIFD